MSMKSHVAELQKKHQNLSAEVEAAQRSPGFDHMKIQAMKRRKLHLKEQISKFGD